MNKWERRGRKVNKRRASKQLSKSFKQLETESPNKKAAKLRFRLARRAKEATYNVENITEEE